MLFSIAYIFFGLLTAFLGAYLLVNSAIVAARQLAVSPLVIGLTIVAFGTSLPELLVCTLASLQQADQMVIGCLVGSNIFNILAILGFCALLSPLQVRREVVVIDIPVMVATSIGFWWLANLQLLAFWWVALILFGLLGLYSWFQWRYSRHLSYNQHELVLFMPLQSHADLVTTLIITLAGLIALGVGSYVALEQMGRLVNQFQMDELSTSATLLAIGVSLPKLITSFYATLKGQKDIAIGNVIGSNVFNLLGVGGMAVLVSPKGLEVSYMALAYDIPVMCAASLACIPFCLSGSRLSRGEGMLFLFFYLCYLVGMLLWSSAYAAVIWTTRYAVGFTALLSALMICYIGWNIRRRQR